MWRAVAQPRHGRGLLLGFVHSAAHTVWFTVDQRSWSMDLQQGAWWTKSTVSSPWLGSRAPSSRTGGRRGGVPLFSSAAVLPSAASAQRASVAVLVSDWGGGKLPRATATASAGSRWRPELPKVLAMASGGSAVLAGGEVAHASSPVASAGQRGLLRFRGCTTKASRAQAGLRTPRWPFGAPAAMATRCQRRCGRWCATGSGGVSRWSRCARGCMCF